MMFMVVQFQTNCPIVRENSQSNVVAYYLNQTHIQVDLPSLDAQAWISEFVNFTRALQVQKENSLTDKSQYCFNEINNNQKVDFCNFVSVVFEETNFDKRVVEEFGQLQEEKLVYYRIGDNTATVKIVQDLVIDEETGEVLQKLPSLRKSISIELGKRYYQIRNSLISEVICDNEIYKVVNKTVTLPLECENLKIGFINGESTRVQLQRTSQVNHNYTWKEGDTLDSLISNGGSVCSLVRGEIFQLSQISCLWYEILVGGMCQACQEFEHVVDNRCQALVCEEYEVITNHTCQALCDEDWIYQEGECVLQQCGDNQELIDGNCFECSPTQTLVNNTCVERTCEEGQIMVNGVCMDRSCEFDEVLVNGSCQTIVCEFFQIIVLKECQECPENQIAVENACVEVICEDDQYLVDRVCQDIICGQNQVIENGNCVDIQCEAGSVLEDGVCIPLRCRPNQIIVANECLDCGESEIVVGNACEENPCPPNFELVGIVCVEKLCPGDLVNVGGVCVELVCKVGEIKIDGQCVPIKCRPDQIVINGECIDDDIIVECEENEVLEDGVCVDGDKVMNVGMGLVLLLGLALM